jgi:hypothetical protein
MLKDKLILPTLSAHGTTEIKKTGYQSTGK